MALKLVDSSLFLLNIATTYLPVYDKMFLQMRL